MKPIWLYTSLARIRLLDFRAKIMLVAFVGTHVPLIAVVPWTVARAPSGWSPICWCCGPIRWRTLR